MSRNRKPKAANQRLRLTRRNPVILLGPPGAAKGTLAKQLVNLLGIPHIFSGNLLRNQVRNDSAIGREIGNPMRMGQLVPDNLICTIIGTRSQELDCMYGFILDGFPRTLTQAIALEEQLSPSRSHNCCEQLEPVVLHIP